MILNTKPIEPFAFDQRMKSFYAGIVIRAANMRISARHLLRGLPIGSGYILTSPVRMYDQGLCDISRSFGNVDGIDNAGYFHGIGKSPCDDLP